MYLGSNLRYTVPLLATYLSSSISTVRTYLIFLGKYQIGVPAPFLDIAFKVMDMDRSRSESKKVNIDIYTMQINGLMFSQTRAKTVICYVK